MRARVSSGPNDATRLARHRMPCARARNSRAPHSPMRSPRAASAHSRERERRGNACAKLRSGRALACVALALVCSWERRARGSLRAERACAARARLLRHGLAPESHELTMGTVIRGNEWSGASENDRAVLSALSGLARAVGPKNVVVFVDRKDACEDAPEYLKGMRCVGLELCVHPVYKSPTMPCIFDKLLAETRTAYVGFVNGDILVFRDFLSTFSAVAAAQERFMMVGRRRNAVGDVVRMDALDEKSWTELEAAACGAGVDGGGAIDYFVLPMRDASYLREIPPFIIGNWRWDNVVLSIPFILQNGVRVVDATPTVVALHQGRDKIARRDHRPASVHNNDLAIKHVGKAYRLGSILCAPFATAFRDGKIVIRRKLSKCKYREYAAASHARERLSSRETPTHSA